MTLAFMKVMMRICQQVGMKNMPDTMMALKITTK
jgi:hypothetical protein